jgi:hypothetical protein
VNTPGPKAIPFQEYENSQKLGSMPSWQKTEINNGYEGIHDEIADKEGEYLISQLPQGGARGGVEIGEALSVEENQSDVRVLRTEIRAQPRGCWLIRA